MTTVPVLHPLEPGEQAPDFELPAADADGTVALATHLQRGPVLLVMLRGLYCPFCRRQISQLRPTCDLLRTSRIALLGVVIASTQRARQYFGHFPPCFPIAASPDRTLHRAYGLPEAVRSPEFRQETERKAGEILAGMGVQVPAGQAAMTLATAGGFDMTSEDTAEMERPLQAGGYFLIDTDGAIKWSRVGITEPLQVDELLALV
jgi:peroxiredoxin